MKYFHFRLEPILRLRKHARDACRLRLAAALEHEAVLMAELSRLTSELLTEQRRGARLGAIDLASIDDSVRYLASLESQRHAVEQQQATAARDVELRQGELAEAEREVRQLEMLREKQALRSRAESEGVASREMDEIAVFSRHACVPLAADKSAG